MEILEKAGRRLGATDEAEDSNKKGASKKLQRETETTETVIVLGEECGLA